MNNTENNGNQKDKITKKVVLIGVIILIVIALFLAVVGILNRTQGTENDVVVNTEVGTTPDGEVVVVQGTNPDGVIIENGTYPDGTQVEVATQENGEPATSADGSYVINYPAYSGQTNNSNSQSAVDNSSTSDNSKNDNSVSDSDSSKQDSSNSKNDSSKPSSSSSQVSSNVGNSESSSQTSSNTGSTTAIINGTQYNIGDKIKVSFYMTSSVKFSAVNAHINYDENILDVDEESLNLDSLAGAMGNAGIEGEVRITAVNATAVNDFSKEKLFSSCVFEIKNTNTSASNITLNVLELLDDNVNNISNDKYSIRAVIEKV
ncbi:MAG: hypothetical protein UH239_01365 [Acutalibacteraceae bacterium]|nr:hypothetical protein [Acutalibacteraceae bacterium]